MQRAPLSRQCELPTAIAPAFAGAVDGRWDTTEGASRQDARAAPRAAVDRVDGRFDFLNDFNVFASPQAKRAARRSRTEAVARAMPAR
jgi:hypothetical protein